MNSKTRARIICAATLALAATAAPTLAGTALAMITYQGQLQNNGSNVNGPINFEYRLFTQEIGGTQIGSTVFRTETVSDGVFTSRLDFGLHAYTSTEETWIEVVADGETLPRQLLTAVPYSLATRGINVEPSGHVGIGAEDLGSTYFFRVNSGAEKGVSVFDFPGRLTVGLHNGGTLDGSSVRFSGLPGGDFWDAGQQQDNSFTISNGPGVPNTFRLTPGASNAAGRLGIGTIPTSKLHVDTDGENALRISTNNDALELFNVGHDGAVRMTDVAHRFGGPNGFGNVLLNLSAENWDFGLNITGGDAGKPGGGSWANTSDVRLKKSINTLDGALDTLLSLRGVTYEYKDPEAIGELAGLRTGFIAQEVETVIPDWVWEAEDGYKRVTIRGFEAMAVESLRELKSANDELRSRLAALENAPATSVMTSSMTWPLLGLGGLGIFAALRRRSA